MNIRDRRAIHHAARVSLEGDRKNARHILLIYLIIVTGLSLLVTGISVALNDRIADTGGLGSMGLRSVLSTAQSVLPLARLLILLGLELGYCGVALRISRGEPVEPSMLFQGFRRFFPLLGATILQALIYLALIMVCIYAGTYIFLMLPMSEEFNALMAPLAESMTVLDTTAALDDATLLAAFDAMMPMYWIVAALFLPLFVPMYYRYRMVSYRLVDQPRPRAMAALRESSTMMRRNRFALLRLDLSLWWFYLLQVVIVLVGYGDMLLPLLGITLPLSATAASLLCFGLSLALQFVIYLLTMNRVAVTYATAYDALLPKEQTAQKAPQTPAVPWQNQY